jgi:hypothetical protein
MILSAQLGVEDRQTTTAAVRGDLCRRCGFWRWRGSGGWHVGRRAWGAITLWELGAGTIDVLHSKCV